MAHNQQMSAATLLAFLSERFDLSTANTDDLEFLSFASDSAAHEADTLREVVEGIGSLIDADLQIEHVHSGFLQQNDLPTLLWSIAGQIGVIGHMTKIGSTAEYELWKRADAVSKEKFFRISTHQQSSKDKVGI